MDMEFSHYSVMREQCIDALNINPRGVYVDCTLGGGGHSEEIVKRLEGGLLIGIDRDADAISAASKRLEKYKASVRLVHANFKDIKPRFQKLAQIK